MIRRSAHGAAAIRMSEKSFQLPLTLHGLGRLTSDKTHQVRDLAVDRESFDRLMTEHLDSALRLAIRLSGGVASAEDIVQEAMLRASRGWQGFRGQSRFGTWLFQIVINVFRDQLRRRSSRTLEPVDDDVIDPRTASAAQIVSGEELGELLARHVSALPPRQREVLVLVAYEQMTPSQAAAVLEISEQNARTNLHLARQTLKKLLADYLQEDCCERGPE